MYLPGGGSTGLILPDEVVDIDKLNSNFRIVDNLLGARNIPSSSAYSGSMDGDLVYAQDTGFLHMYSGSEARLLTPRLPGARQYSGTAAERVAFAVQAKNGDLWRDTDNIGVIWAYKAGSPGAWEYTGNALRGTKAAMNQLVTDGRAVVGMKCYCTDDNSEYVARASTATPPVLSWALNLFRKDAHLFDTTSGVAANVVFTTFNLPAKSHAAKYLLTVQGNVGNASAGSALISGGNPTTTAGAVTSIKSALVTLGTGSWADLTLLFLLTVPAGSAAAISFRNGGTAGVIWRGVVYAEALV